MSKMSSKFLFFLALLSAEVCFASDPFPWPTPLRETPLSDFTSYIPVPLVLARPEEVEQITEPKPAKVEISYQALVRVNKADFPHLSDKLPRFEKLDENVEPGTRFVHQDFVVSALNEDCSTNPSECKTIRVSCADAFGRSDGICQEAYSCAAENAGRSSKDLSGQCLAVANLIDTCTVKGSNCEYIKGVGYGFKQLASMCNKVATNAIAEYYRHKLNKAEYTKLKSICGGKPTEYVPNIQPSEVYLSEVNETTDIDEVVNGPISDFQGQTRTSLSSNISGVPQGVIDYRFPDNENESPLKFDIEIKMGLYRPWPLSSWGDSVDSCVERLFLTDRHEFKQPITTGLFMPKLPMSVKQYDQYFLNGADGNSTYAALIEQSGLSVRLSNARPSVFIDTIPTQLPWDRRNENGASLFVDYDMKKPYDSIDTRLTMCKVQVSSRIAIPTQASLSLIQNEATRLENELNRLGSVAEASTNNLKTKVVEAQNFVDAFDAYADLLKVDFGKLKDSISIHTAK